MGVPLSACVPVRRARQATPHYASVVVVVSLVVVPVTVTGATLADDLLGAPGEFQDVHPIANAVNDDDVAAVVDFNVVGHVGVVRRCRYIEPNLHGSLWIADVPHAHTGVEVRSERQLAIVRIAEVLLDRMRAKALAA